MKIIKILILMILISLNISAQDIVPSDTDSLSEKIFLIAKNNGKKITLRWAPSSPGAWHLSNFAGYMVERLSYKDSSDFHHAKYELLTQNPLKPWKLEKWEPLIMTSPMDKYAALAAQAIWGKRNNSDPQNKNASFIEKSKEFNNLFSTAMLAAEFSANVAIASGLRYEDNNIDSSLTYFYKVYSLVNNLDFPIDTAYIVVNGNDIYKNIEVKIDEVFENDREVILSWNRDYEKYYSGWFIEKSKDGENFSRLNESPYINSPTDNLGIKSNTIIYSDSLEHNYTKYHYRIIGIDPFAEYSAPSTSVSAMGRDRTPPPAPQNIKAKEITPGKMEISWSMLNESDDLKGFLVSRSNEINKNEVGLTNEILPPETRSFIDTTYDEIMNNWYYVYSVDTAGNAIVGIPQYGSIIDSFPPNPPTGLTGSIDSNGIVNIKWNLGNERDIYGYTVFSANQKDHIFITVNNIPIRDTSFTDTITLKTLTEHIYYKIAAVDMAKNISEFSEMLTLKKPDIIPPAEPVFTDYKVTKKGIKLTWVQSTSQDVKTHFLYRRKRLSEEWKLIYRTDELKKYDTYIDDGTIPGTAYEYKIIAQDDDGLYSDISFIINVTAIDFNDILPVNKLDVFINNEKNQASLKWNYPKEGDFQVQIFRALNGGGFYFLKQTGITDSPFIDNDIKEGNSYEYTLKVIDKNKKVSGFCPIAKIDLATVK